MDKLDYRSIGLEKKCKQKRHKKLLVWLTVATTILSLIALVIAVTSLILIMKTSAEPKVDQLHRQFNLQDVKQMLGIDELQTQTTRKVSASISLPVPASGHLLFLQSDLKDGPSFTNDHPVPVKLDVKSSHRGVNVSEDGVKILNSGIYWVYNSVNYKLTTKKCSEVTYQEWFFYIIRQNQINDLEKTLLKSIYNCCEGCSQIEETKFIGGLFYLESGDTITVKSSGDDLFGGSQESSFLGLVMMSSGQTVSS